MGGLLLEVNDLKTYFYQRGGVVKAVDGVSYKVLRRESVGIVGESGCGKTINAWSLMRLIPPSARVVDGQILLHRLFAGQEHVVDLATVEPEGDLMCRVRGGDIGMVFQEPMSALSPLHSVGNQITEAILLHEHVGMSEARERAIDLLARSGIPRPRKIIDEFPHQLSGGMRQRVMISIALSCNPSLLIADEPTTMLDVTIQAQILELMRELQRELGMSILFITHDLAVIAQMVDRVLVMYLGKIVESASIEDIFYDPQHPYTRALLKSIPGGRVEPKTRLETIRGSVPGPYADITGCPFYGRCPERMNPICVQEFPPRKAVGERHEVSCHLYN